MRKEVGTVDILASNMLRAESVDKLLSVGKKWINSISWIELADMLPERYLSNRLK